MTNHVARLYAAAVSLVGFFLAWAAIAAHPWSTPTADPAVAALAAREQRLQADSVAVKQLTDRRWAAYRSALAAQKAAAAAAATAPAPAAPAAPAAPSVRVVTLPPLTVTRTS